MNRRGIPKELEQEVKIRDKNCVYCGIRLQEVVARSGSSGCLGTWEHIINDAKIITHANIVRCCASCNSSKGTKSLFDWMRSNYCLQRKINKFTVAPIVRKALRNI